MRNFMEFYSSRILLFSFLSVCILFGLSNVFAQSHMNVNIAEPCPPDTEDMLIDSMEDAAGNVVELRCENGMYILRFIRPDGSSRVIGKCIYPWGENAGWKSVNAEGVFDEITWYNYEGHDGHNNNAPVHDTNGDGRENRDCYIYDVDEDTLAVRRDDRSTNQTAKWEGRSNHRWIHWVG